MNNQTPPMDPWQEETSIKEQLYNNFDKELAQQSKNEERLRGFINMGDGKDSAFEYSSYRTAISKNDERRQLITSLSKKPYFAHVDVKYEFDGSIVVSMLSDNEELESPYQFGENSQVVPFKQSDQTPMLTQLFRCYSASHTFSDF